MISEVERKSESIKLDTVLCSRERCECKKCIKNKNSCYCESVGYLFEDNSQHYSPESLGLHKADLVYLVLEFGLLSLCLLASLSTPS